MLPDLDGPTPTPRLTAFALRRRRRALLTGGRITTCLASHSSVCTTSPGLKPKLTPASVMTNKRYSLNIPSISVLEHRRLRLDRVQLLYLFF